MKKICLLLSLVLALLPCLTSCAAPTYYFDSEWIKSNVTKVQLVYFHQDEAPERIRNMFWFIYDPDLVLDDICFEDSDLIKELEQDKIPAFADKLSEVAFFDENSSSLYPIGYSLLMYLKDGNIIVISQTSDTGSRDLYDVCAMYTSDGKFIKHIAHKQEHYDEVIYEFFGIELYRPDGYIR